MTDTFKEVDVVAVCWDTKREKGKKLHAYIEGDRVLCNFLLGNTLRYSEAGAVNCKRCLARLETMSSVVDMGNHIMVPLGGVPGAGKVVLFDREDYPKVVGIAWSENRDGYVNAGVFGKTVLAHRYVMDAPRGQRIDHVNGNKMDNRKENLRFCTHSQNIANRGKTVQNQSGYKGVCFHKPTQKWSARIRVMGKGHHLGVFDEAKDAARAYDKAAIKYFGEFARPNLSEGE